MQVYVEYVIINNLMINALVLILTLKFMRHKINKLAVFLASAIGAIYALFVPICDKLNLFALKVLLSLIMLAIILGRCKLKKYLCACAIFYGLTFAMGGIVMGIGNMLSYELKDVNSSLIPFYAALSGLSLIAAQKLIFKSVTLAKRKSKYENQVILSANGKSVECKAYYDSGNRLYYKNKPTIIIDESIALEFYGQIGLNDIKDYTQIDTVIGKKQIKVFPLDYILDKENGQEIYGVMAAISEKIKGEYKVVLHCDL
ncbi:MAG: sigma-E processing peptidase SpoIIGA [Clostridia bacterium]|nr:sigma-E processing peptidase SpoIIGA [Clostridia bacterium]